MQDYMGLDNKSRMNQPSTLGTNWKWRMVEGQLSDELLGEILEVTSVYGRKAWHPQNKVD
jgi:4-alpha-glucanotransferase